MGFVKRKDKDVARVTTAKVEKIDLISKVTANGKIQARRKVDLSALVMGQIVNLAAKEGDRVQKGQLLLQIDRAQLAAQTAGRESALGAMRSDLVAAQSTADQARYDYERARRNWEAKILSEAEMQKTKSAYDTAQANLSAARAAASGVGGEPRGEPGLPFEDDGERADRGRRDLPPGQGG